MGTRHPISLVRNEICDIFGRLGFSIAEGPEVEDDWHVFSALNFAEDHPARDMQDTFFIEKNPDILLLDEPFRLLEPERIFVMQQLLLHLGSEGRTVLLSSTRIHLLEGVCDDLYLLGGGRVLARYEHYELGRAEQNPAAGGGFPGN